MNGDRTVRDLSLLTVRMVLGGSISAHGLQKMLGAFDGPGMEGTTQMMRSLGFEPPERFARAVAATETTSGMLIAVGALGPVGPAMLLSVMLTAIETVHKPKGYWAGNGGYEMNTMYILLALVLATHGYGPFSVDRLLGMHEKMGAMLGWLALLGGVAGATVVLSQRKPPPQNSTQGDTPAPEPAMSAT